MEKSHSDKSNKKTSKERNVNNISNEWETMVVFERVNSLLGIIYDEHQDVEMEE